MADNVTLPAQGTGDTLPVVATDQITGVHHQYVKVEYGADNSATPVSTSNPLPVNANAGTNLNTSALALETGGNLAAIKADVDKLPSQGQALAAGSMPVVLPALQITALTPPAAITGFALDATLSTTNTEVGGLTETAPATDTASSGLNGRLQRIAQRLTSLIALLPASLSNGFFQVSVKETISLPVTGAFFQVTQPVSGTVTSNAGTNLNTSALALETGGNLAAIKTDVDKIPSQGQALAAASMPVVLPATQIITLTPPAAITGFALDATLSTTNTDLGGVTETAPATDTASSGLNGRLQRIAQRLTSIIALLPTALGAGGGLKVDGSGTALPVSGTVTSNVVYPTYGVPFSGELVGIASATQLPNIASKWVVIKAEYNNAGSVYIGISGVTKAAGATSTTAGLQLRPGDSTPVMEITNLNLLYRICDNVGDSCTYIGVSS